MVNIYGDYFNLLHFIFTEAKARILGATDVYVKTGSLVTLTCLMSQGPHDLGTVAWYRDHQPVVTSARNENDIDAEPRINVETEWSDALTSRYIIIFLTKIPSKNLSHLLEYFPSDLNEQIPSAVVFKNHTNQKN